MGKEKAMSRIQITDSTLDVLTKMCDGNPGALNAMMEVMSHAKVIDPQSALEGMGVILSFDTSEIYGTEIYILFNDQCNRDVRQLLVLMRAVQLGFIGEQRVKQIAKDQMGQNLLTETEMSELDKKVCQKLEGFMTKDKWSSLND